MTAAATLEAFIAVLRREQDALAAGDIDALAPLVAEKIALAEALSRITPDATAALRDLASTAQALNETNGRLIALRLQHNQQALNVLLAAANTAATYGPDGQQQPGLGSRILGKA